jgi:hypothetical protein
LKAGAVKTRSEATSGRLGEQAARAVIERG